MPRHKMPTPLEELLAQQIATEGQMGVGAFMSAALMHPQFGYYVTRDPFGARGDFTTAPEISQMFGEMIAVWIIDTWHKLGAPEHISLVEFGAGRGTLMADILRVLSRTPAMADAFKVYIIEGSDFLRGGQRKLLQEYTNIIWVESIAQVPKNPAILMGNEFLDALPVHQMVFHHGAWKERKINYAVGKGFYFAQGAAAQDLLQYIPQKYHAESMVENFIFEVSPERLIFLQDCADFILHNKGACLFIDYGYLENTGGETLQAVKAHKFVDPLVDIGNADITAHVDFGAAYNAVKRRGCECAPIVMQGDFLQRLGIELRAKMLRDNAKTLQRKSDVAAALTRLMDAHEMGALFKVLCFYHGLNDRPAGFK